MEVEAGAQSSRRTRVQSVLILLASMLMVGILTRVVPVGTCARADIIGREIVEPVSFRCVDRLSYPFWHWLTAPAEGLWVPGFFLLIVGALNAGLFNPAMLDYALPTVGLFFLIGGAVAGLLSGAGRKLVLQAVGEGLSGNAPPTSLMLMTARVKHTVVQGSVMDSPLWPIQQTQSF